MKHKVLIQHIKQLKINMNVVTHYPTAFIKFCRYIIFPALKRCFVKLTVSTGFRWGCALVVFSAFLYSCTAPSTFLSNEEIARSALRHIEFFASDAMQGRGIPSHELDLSADYIAKEFQSYGLESVNGSYFQNFELFRTKLGNGNSLTINGASGVHTLEIEKDYMVFDFSATYPLSNAGVVFVGYGIIAKEQKWDDYANIDVKNKIVVAIAGEPNSPDTTFFDGYQLTKHSYTETKLRAAQTHGAVGMIIIGDPRYNPQADFKTTQFNAGHPRPKSIRPNPQQNHAIVGLSDYGAIRKILFPSDNVLTNLIAEMTTKRTSRSYALLQTVSATIDKNDEKIPVRNVIGLLRGTSPDDGFIVVGAHYDHLGVDHNIASRESGKSDIIFNGADDNASGTAGVLLSAKILSDISKRPKKSILFVCFTAEETGLYGSQVFVQNCPMNIKECKGMINMDMIGRNHTDSLSIGGGSHFPELSDITKKANLKLEQQFFIAENIEKFYLRSDQANFAKAGIPVVFFSSGLHSDYHQPSDEVFKVDVRKVGRVSRLCAETALAIANTTNGK